jgi:rhodanese-related sulfurtransferase
VEELAARMLPAKEAPVVVYCASATCQNSHIAAERLSLLGYKDVQVYVEGKKDWIDAGLPVDGKY